MRICSNCGAVNDDSRYICQECGMLLDTGSGNGGRKKSVRIPKQVLLIIAAVLAVSLLAVGIVALVSGLGNNVENAFQRTIEDFSGEEEQRTQFQQFLVNSEDWLEDGSFSMETTFSGGKVTVELQANYDRKQKLVCGDLNIAGFQLEYSANKKIVQFRFPGEYEVYGFNTDDLNKLIKKINGFLDLPIVSELAPVELPADLKMDLFSKSFGEDLMEKVAGEQYDAFMKTVKTERWNDEVVTINGKDVKCKVHKISWKSEAMNNLLAALSSGGLLPDVGELINSFLPEMDPYIYCYINNEGYMTGVRFTAAGSKCFLLLEGEENLWDNFTLTAENISGEVKVYQGRTVRDGAYMDMYLTDGTTKLFSLTYDDDSGDFQISTISVPDLLSGKVNADDGEVSIQLYWTIPDMGTQELTWRIGKLRAKPEQLGEHFTDMMTLSWTAIENMLIDLVKAIAAAYMN